MKSLVFGSTIFLVLLFGAGGVFVSAADAAAPGDLLYPVDRGLESLRLEFTSNPQSTAQLHTQFAVERLREVQSILENGNLEYLDLAISEAGLVLSELEEPVIGQIELTPESLANIVNQTLQQELEQDDENEDEEGDENEENSTIQDADGDEDLDAKDKKPEPFKQPKSGVYCSDEALANQPAAEKLAAQFEVEYSEVMDWFCQGYGFGEVKLGYLLSQQAGVSAADIFAMRGSGVGWENIMKEYGLIGKAKGKP